MLLNRRAPELRHVSSILEDYSIQNVLKPDVSSDMLVAANLLRACYERRTLMGGQPHSRVPRKGPGRGPAIGTPRWFYAFGIAFAALAVLLFLVQHFIFRAAMGHGH